LDSLKNGAKTDKNYQAIQSKVAIKNKANLYKNQLPKQDIKSLNKSEVGQAAKSIGGQVLDQTKLAKPISDLSSKISGGAKQVENQISVDLNHDEEGENADTEEDTEDFPSPDEIMDQKLQQLNFGANDEDEDDNTTPNILFNIGEDATQPNPDSDEEIVSVLPAVHAPIENTMQVEVINFKSPSNWIKILGFVIILGLIGAAIYFIATQAI
jgi:hypothetical protein